VRLSVVGETLVGERRVAMVPDVVPRLRGAGWEIVVQARAGERAFFSDDAYRAAGATIAGDAEASMQDASMVVRVNPPTVEEAKLVPDRAALLSFLQPGDAVDALAVLAAKEATYFSFDLLPRISRAQSMDALSSQATVAGYRAGLLAAERLAKFFPMLMTAAGTVPPARVLVMGVGVAGLQAIATARRLGAVVRAFDVRAAAKEEAESVGAAFLEVGVVAEGTGGYARELTDDELRRQRQALADEVAASDVVITTAAVPGRRAPMLVTTETVARMPAGALVIDLAADQGGNCEATVAGADVVVGGATVVGLANPASGMPTHASLLYARNVESLLGLLVRDGSLHFDWDDEVLRGSCALRHGERPGTGGAPS
jgi:NAD(P) transhydrogenase subunit alpha